MKRFLATIMAMVCVGSLSVVAFAYSLDGYASATGSASGVNFSGRISTNCPKSELEYSNAEFSVYESGREIYYSVDHDKTSFSDSWRIGSPEPTTYECYMFGEFKYKNLPKDDDVFSDSMDVIGYKGRKSVDHLKILSSGFREYLSKEFDLTLEQVDCVERYSEVFLIWIYC